MMPNDLNPILTKAKSLKDYPKLKNVTHSHEIHNRLCGDSLWFDLEIDNNTLKNVSIRAEACSLCKASSAILIDMLKNKEISKARDTITKNLDAIPILFQKHPIQHINTESPLSIFYKLDGYQTRKRCVTLTWEGMASLLTEIAK